MDELTTGLDTEARRSVWQTLLKLKETNLTIFLTTHYMEEAETLCDRLLLIKRGNIVAEGSISELLEESSQNSLEEAYLWYVGRMSMNKVLSLAKVEGKLALRSIDGVLLASVCH